MKRKGLLPRPKEIQLKLLVFTGEVGLPHTYIHTFSHDLDLNPPLQAPLAARQMFTNRWLWDILSPQPATSLGTHSPACSQASCLLHSQSSISTKHSTPILQELTHAPGTLPSYQDRWPHDSLET